MVTYFISPFDPPQWTGESNMVIQVDEYIEAAKKRWPQIKLLEDATTDHIFLRWELSPGGLEGLLMGENRNQPQIVSMNGVTDEIIEFTLWHRSVIPKAYRLYFFDEGLGIQLELGMDVAMTRATLLDKLK